MSSNTSSKAMWQRFRTKPGLYLGEPSITALYHTINGYELALGTHGIVTDHSLRLPADFNDWIAYRLQFFESTSGWKNMLLKACGNENAAFLRFFELLDEHEARSPRVFAVADCEKASVSGTSSQAKGHRIELLTYTNDPGFFAAGTNLGEPCRQTFYPLFRLTAWTEMETHSTEWRLKCRRFEVLEPKIIARLEAEAADYDEGESRFRR